jgi:hypothetical protein
MGSKRGLPAFCAALLLPSLAAAQPAPLTPPVRVSQQGTIFNYVPALAPAPGGGFVATWTRWDSPGRQVLARRLDPALTPLGDAIPVSQSPVTEEFDPSAVAVHASGNFLVVWQGAVARLMARPFDPAGAPRGGEVQLAAYPEQFGTALLPDAAATPEGFLVVWEAPAPTLEAGTGIFGRRFSPLGEPLGAEFRLDEGTSRFQLAPRVAVFPSGGFVAVWVTRVGEENNSRIIGRRFDADGVPLGDEFQIDSGTVFSPSSPDVAASPDGGFVVAWDAFLRGTRDVWFRRYGPDGSPLGGERLAHDRRDTQVGPSVSVDESGAFAIAWSQASAAGGEAAVQSFDAAGQFRGPRFTLQPRGGGLPVVVAGPPGELTVAWQGSGDRQRQTVAVFAQRFRLPPPGADACFAADGRLVCDTLRNGGNPTLDLSFQLQAGDVPLLGDLDGNGQDDPCRFRAGRFVCDVAHDGRPLAFQPAFDFGAAGDLPLLGDLNGDGRDDPCVRRVRRFSCDTARDGGGGEVQVIFGRRTDTALLGDVDGDGDDDPCLFRGDRFLCDTAHDGRNPELTVVFGQPGDTPLLGDVDGDGDEDFCVFRGDRFLCDTARDGGAAEVEIPFARPGATPLLGNVDGF